MFRKLGHVLLIVALLAAVGGHWVVLQSAAWTNMLAKNLRTDSVTVAFEKTFDGQHPCCLCKAIKEGKKSDKKSELPMPLLKFEFVSEQPVFVFSPPLDFCGCLSLLSQCTISPVRRPSRRPGSSPVSSPPLFLRHRAEISF